MLEDQIRVAMTPDFSDSFFNHNAWPSMFNSIPAINGSDFIRSVGIQILMFSLDEEGEELIFPSALKYFYN